MKNEDFILVQGWMINELHLKGNELLVFAIIFGYSKDGEHYFHGSLNYMADTIGSTKKTIISVLQSLEEQGLILKRESITGGVKFCEYQAVLGGGVKITPVVKNFPEGGVKITPNNNNINIYNNNNNKYSAKTKDEREQAFAEKCNPYRPKYGDAMVDKFIYYWTEGENKMRFEKQDVFEVGRRLATWAQRDAERNPQPQPQAEPKKHLSVDEIMRKHYGIE